MRYPPGQDIPAPADSAPADSDEDDPSREPEPDPTWAERSRAGCFLGWGR